MCLHDCRIYSLLFLYYLLIYVPFISSLRFDIFPLNTTLDLPYVEAMYSTAPPFKNHSIYTDLIYANPPNACSPLINNVTGKIVLVLRGVCLFLSKSQNVEAAGGVAMIAYNLPSWAPTSYGYIPLMSRAENVNTTVGIPCLSISRRDGLLLLDYLQVNQSIRGTIYQEPIQPHQKLALQSLTYNVPNHPWLMWSDPCTVTLANTFYTRPSQFGLQCNSEGMITTLRLTTVYPANILSFNGPIPENYFSNFTALWYYGIRDKTLTGSLPKFLEDLTNLRALAISNTQLSNVSSEAFMKMNKLIYLDLSFNAIQASLPSILSSQINYLALNRNDFYGIIPSSWSNLGLEYLDISENSLSGVIPLFPTNLTRLALHRNNFTHFVPNSIYPLVDYFSIGYNNLQLLPLDLLNNLTTATYIDLSYNQLTNLPDFRTLTKLQTLVISGNLFSGNFPGFFPVNLKRLEAASNKFTTILAEFGAQPSLTYLDLSNNSLTGRLTADFTLLFPKTLTQLQLSHNHITCDRIQFNAILSSLIDIDLSYNQLNYTLPTYDDLPVTTRTLDLSNNFLYGEIEEMYGQLSLDRLSLQNNNLRSIRNTLPSYLEITFSVSISIPERGLECPEYRFIGKPLASVTIDPEYHRFSLCRCLPNYFYPSASYSNETNCLPCLQYATCPGREATLQSIPSNLNIVAQRGYFPIPSPEQPLVMLPCRFAAMLPDSADNPCNPDSTTGKNFTRFACAPGYADRLCSRCLEGYFWKDGRCLKCTEHIDYPLFPILLILIFLILSLFFLLRPPLKLTNENLYEKVAYFTLLDDLGPLIVNFFQNTTIITSKFDHVRFISDMQKFFGLMTFSAPSTGLGFECGPQEFRIYENQYKWILGFPMLLIAVLGLLFLIKFILSYGYSLYRNSNWYGYEIFYQEFKHFLYGLLYILHLLYFPLVTYIVSTFQCNIDPISKLSYLANRPYLRCDVISSGSKAIALLVYPIGIFILFTLFSFYFFITYKKGSQESSFLLQIFGFFFLPYKSDYVMSEIILMIKRLSLSFVVGLISVEQDIFPLLVLFILFLSLLYFIFGRPFREDWLNRVEIVGECVTIFIFVNSLIFSAKGLFPESTPAPAIIYISFTLGLLFYALGSVYYQKQQFETELKDNQNRSQRNLTQLHRHHNLTFHQQHLGSTHHQSRDSGELPPISPLVAPTIRDLRIDNVGIDDESRNRGSQGARSSDRLLQSNDDYIGLNTGSHRRSEIGIDTEVKTPTDTPLQSPTQTEVNTEDNKENSEGSSIEMVTIAVQDYIANNGIPVPPSSDTPPQRDVATSVSTITHF